MNLAQQFAGLIDAARERRLSDDNHLCTARRMVPAGGLEPHSHEAKRDFPHGQRKIPLVSAIRRIFPAASAPEMKVGN
jgi:hypothetical protein